LGDGALLGELFRLNGISVAVHFAGSVVVPGSVAAPLKYYLNNSPVSRNLIQACVEGGVRKFVFSSSAAVYGLPDTAEAAEDAPITPVNPYGASKLVTEWMLCEAAAAHDYQYAALRYFNVVGADLDGRAGQSTMNATHLIKVACEVAVGLRHYIELFGEDYDTPGATSVRDYIHVTELVTAHLDAIRYLDGSGGDAILNCGYGRGYSVREVPAAVQRESGLRLDIRVATRRPGDPAWLVANADAIRKRFGWRPQHDDLSLIVRTALTLDSI
jgi:UDP-glucose 4-epimerase